MPTLSAVVIAANEERNIRECVEGLSFCDEIVVVDSGSRDRTGVLAERAGAKVFFRVFDDFSSQKNFGVQQASGEWVLLLDADERLSPDAPGEIRAAIARGEADWYAFLRRNRIFGRWMRHGAHRNDRPLRLVKKACAVFEGRVHERLRGPGITRNLKSVIWHYSTDSVGEYMRKLNLYSSLEAAELERRGTAFSMARMRLAPVVLFFDRSVRRLGFLDGREGFLFNTLSAYNEFIRWAKRWEQTN